LELHDASADRHFSICDGTDAQFCLALLPILARGFAGAVLIAFPATVLGPSALSATLGLRSISPASRHRLDRDGDRPRKATAEQANNPRAGITIEESEGFQSVKWSEREDLNLRPLVSQGDSLDVSFFVLSMV
jgi:hypothetical protein